MFLITNRAIDVSSLLSSANKENGAVAAFMGTVRNHSGGREVVALHYFVYTPMALKSFRDIADEVRNKWGVTQLSIVHRIGRLSVGDVAVAVVALAPHRREALAACSYAIDAVKATTPIWKKEFYSDHEGVWIEGCGAPAEEKTHVHAH